MVDNRGPESGSEAYNTALQQLLRDRWPSMAAGLRKRFSGLAAPVVDEVLQDTLVDASDPARSTWLREGLTLGGPDELARRLYTMGWRQLRGEHRRVATQRTDRLHTDFEAVAEQTSPLQQVQAQQLVAKLDADIGDAAQRFGRSRADTLDRALHSLVRGGHPVKPTAARYDLPRRYLSEASVWLRRRLLGTTEDP